MYNNFKKYDQHIERVQYKTFLPVNNSQLNTPNKTTTFRIDSMDVFLNIANTKFFIYGRYLQNDGKDYPKGTNIQLIDNFVQARAQDFRMGGVFKKNVKHRYINNQQIVL